MPWIVPLTLRELGADVQNLLRQVLMLVSDLFDSTEQHVYDGRAVQRATVILPYY